MTKEEKVELMADRMADFLIALADGRVILEEFRGNVPGWRIAVLPPEPKQ